jgi:hypothetical protein
MIPTEDNQTYLFGLFLGKNIQFVPHDISHPFLPKQIYEYMKSKRYFEIGLGQGVGENFPSLDEDLQNDILKRVEVDIEFTRSLAESLGHNFPSLDEAYQQEILKKLESGMHL